MVFVHCYSFIVVGGGDVAIASFDCVYRTYHNQEYGWEKKSTEYNVNAHLNCRKFECKTIQEHSHTAHSGAEWSSTLKFVWIKRAREISWF